MDLLAPLARRREHTHRDGPQALLQRGLDRQGAELVAQYIDDVGGAAAQREPPILADQPQIAGAV